MPEAGYEAKYSPSQELTLKAGENKITVTAEPIKYKITYKLSQNAVNGEGNPEEYTVEDEITLKDPKRPGYTFKSWYELDGKVINAGTTGDLTLSAVWEADKSEGRKATAYVIAPWATEENAAKYKADDDRIDNWTGHTSDDYIPVGQYDQGSVDKFVVANYAQFARARHDDFFDHVKTGPMRTTLDDKNGCTIKANGTKITVSSPQVTYTADWNDDIYWYVAKTVSRNEAGSTFHIDGWVDWEKAPTEYVVKFETHGGLPIPPDQSVPYGEKAVKPVDDPDKSGSRFTGWYTTADCTTLYNFDTEVTEGITLHAGWTKEHSLKIKVWDDDNNAEISENKVSYKLAFKDKNGQEVSANGFNVPEDTTCYISDITVTAPYEGVGYTVNGGELKSLPEVIQVTMDADKEIVLHVNTPKVTVSFDAVDGSPKPGAQIIVKGEKATKPAPDPAKQYKTFDGWYTADGQKYNFETPVVEDITLYAHYKVSTEVSENTLTQIGILIPGKSKAAENTVSRNGSGEVKGNDVKDYVVIASLDGGSKVSNYITDNYNSYKEDDVNDYITAYVPLEEGSYGQGTNLYKDRYPYTIKKINNRLVIEMTLGADTWQADITDKSCIDCYVIKTPAGQRKEWHVDAEANWTKVINKVTVSFDAVRGLPNPPTQEIVKGEKATKPAPDPVKQYMTFDGWYTAAGRKFNFATTPVRENITLYAHYKVSNEVSDNIAVQVDLLVPRKDKPTESTVPKEASGNLNPSEDKNYVVISSGSKVSKYITENYDSYNEDDVNDYLNNYVHLGVKGYGQGTGRYDERHYYTINKINNKFIVEISLDTDDDGVPELWQANITNKSCIKAYVIRRTSRPDGEWRVHVEADWKKVDDGIKTIVISANSAVKDYTGAEQSVDGFEVYLRDGQKLEKLEYKDKIPGNNFVAGWEFKVDYGSGEQTYRLEKGSVTAKTKGTAPGTYHDTEWSKTPRIKGNSGYEHTHKFNFEYQDGTLEIRPDKFTVSFNTMGGTPATIASQEVQKDQVATKPTTEPSKAGTTFKGWFKDRDCTIPYNFSDPVIEDIELFAGYEPDMTAGKNTTIHILLPGMSQRYQKTQERIPSVNVNNYDKKDYLQIGTAGLTKYLTENYYEYFENDIETHVSNISFYNGSEDGTDDGKIVESGRNTCWVKKVGDKTYIETVVKEKVNNVNKDVLYRTDLSTLNCYVAKDVNKNHTWHVDATVIWVRVGELKTIYISGNSSETVYDGTAKSVSGYTPDDYFTIDGSEYKISDITVGRTATEPGTYDTLMTGRASIKDRNGFDYTGQFNIVYVPGKLVIKKRFTVSFNTMGGIPEVPSEVAPRTVSEGNAVSEPNTSLSKNGFVFEAWYTEAEGGSRYDFSNTVTDDMVLFAHYRPDTGVDVNDAITYVNTPTPEQAADALGDDGDRVVGEPRGNLIEVGTADIARYITSRFDSYSEEDIGEYVSNPGYLQNGRHESNGVVYWMDNGGGLITLKTVIDENIWVASFEVPRWYESKKSSANDEGSHWEVNGSVRWAVVEGGKRKITLSANSDTVPYTGAVQTVEGFEKTEFEIGGETYTVSGLNAKASGKDVGTYDTVSSGNAIVRDSNGNDVSEQFDVTIEPGTLTITAVDGSDIVITGEPVSGEYNGKTWGFNPASVNGISGDYIVVYSFVSGNSYDAGGDNEPGDDDQQSDREAAGIDELTVDEGEYRYEDLPTFIDVTEVGVIAKVKSDNYSNIPPSDVITLSITPRIATARSEGATKFYDGTALTNASEVQIDRLVEGETPAINITGSQTHVGTSDNTFSLADSGRFKLSNYSITNNFGTLEVKPAQVTISAKDYTKTEGDEDPEFEATVSGNIYNNEVTWSLDRAAGEAVGTYAINVSFTGTNDYDVKTNVGTLTIASRGNGGGNDDNGGGNDDNGGGNGDNGGGNDDNGGGSGDNGGGSGDNGGGTTPTTPTSEEITPTSGTFRTPGGHRSSGTPTGTPTTTGGTPTTGSPVLPTTAPSPIDMLPTGGLLGTMAGVDGGLIPAAGAGDVADLMGEVLGIRDEPMAVSEDTAPDDIGDEPDLISDVLGVREEACWIHWLILLLTVIYALYNTIRIGARHHLIKKLEDNETENAQEN